MFQVDDQSDSWWILDCRKEGLKPISCDIAALAVDLEGFKRREGLSQLSNR